MPTPWSRALRSRVENWSVLTSVWPLMVSRVFVSDFSGQGRAGALAFCSALLISPHARVIALLSVYDK